MQYIRILFSSFGEENLQRIAFSLRVVMVDTDDTRRMMDADRWTPDNRRRTTPRVWHKLPTGELKRTLLQKQSRIIQEFLIG